MERFAGGKGLNQSIALARAGTQVVHAGKIGPEGIFLKETLACFGVDTSMIKLGQGSTRHAIIQVDQHGENCILLFGGTNQCITQGHINEAFKDFRENDFLLLQNEISGNREIMQKAGEKGMKIIFNPSPIDSELHQLPLDLVYGFIVNEIEGKYSHNHPMYGGIVRSLFTYVVGIRQKPGSVGFAEVEIAPMDIPGIDWAEGSITTPQGVISVRYRRQVDGTLKVESYVSEQ